LENSTIEGESPIISLQFKKITGTKESCCLRVQHKKASSLFGW